MSSLVVCATTTDVGIYPPTPYERSWPTPGLCPSLLQQGWPGLNPGSGWPGRGEHTSLSRVGPHPPHHAAALPSPQPSAPALPTPACSERGVPPHTSAVLANTEDVSGWGRGGSPPGSPWVPGLLSPTITIQAASNQKLTLPLCRRPEVQNRRVGSTLLPPEAPGHIPFSASSSLGGPPILSLRLHHSEQQLRPQRPSVSISSLPLTFSHEDAYHRI